jgi:hypothetical protein
MKITDKNKALIKVKKNGLALEFTSDRLRDDPEIVKIAVEKNGEALEYASDRLRDDLELRKLANN